jgi:hypothetical protein
MEVCDVESEVILLIILFVAALIGVLIIINPGRRSSYDKDVTSNYNGTRRH